MVSGGSFAISVFDMASFGVRVAEAVVSAAEPVAA
jgi:hypothetical protein